MSLFRRYELIESPDELIIIRRRIRSIILSIVTIGFFVIWYKMLGNQNTSNKNELIYVFYLVPLLALPRIVKSIKSSIKSDKICFNSRLGDLLINDRRRAKLSNISCVIIDYDRNENRQCTLELQTAGEANIILDKSDAGMNSEVVETAKKIASFLKVPVQDLHPYEEKL